MNVAFAIVVVLAAAVVAVLAYRSGRASGQAYTQRTTSRIHEETLVRHQIRQLQVQNSHLDDLNSRYLSFMVSVSSVVQRLNTTLTSDEIHSCISDLVRGVIPTELVDIYLFDKSENCLRRMCPSRQSPENEAVLRVGEGLVGLAAQDGMVKIRGRDHFVPLGQKGKLDSHIWMAVPINFKDRLFGVIGIGEIRSPFGNESSLMKIIADIAGVALVNRSLLGEAKHEANTDLLTGLSNRRYFSQTAQNFVEKSVREGIPISFFLFDIDDFKHYNDTNGHDEGDRLLKELSSLVRGVTRKDCVVARYGGEEFIVMLPGITKEDAFTYAERTRTMIAAHHFHHREKQPLGRISVSGGVASFPVDGDSTQKVIKLADEALYRAKAEGRNRVLMHNGVLFSPPMKERDKDLHGS